MREDDAGSGLPRTSRVCLDGLFLLLTADYAEDALVPDAPYRFGVFKRALAPGGADGEGLTPLGKALESALAGRK